MEDMMNKRLMGASFWVFAGFAVALALFSIYFYAYQVPDPEGIAPGGDRTDSDLRFAAWYAMIALAVSAALGAVIVLVRNARSRSKVRAAGISRSVSEGRQ
jgi:hypothetical protein